MRSRRSTCGRAKTFELLRLKYHPARTPPATEGAMPVTASILYDLVQCPQRVALDTFGNLAQRDEINAFVRLLWERGTLFERETIAKLDQPFTDLSKANDSDCERLTREAMARGDALIYGGRIAADDLLGVPDLLRKESGGYVPGDIKSGRGEEGGGDESDGKPKVHYAVQLALYVDILERLKSSAGRRAFVWDIQGDEVAYDFTTLEDDGLWDAYQDALAEARAILARQTTPLPAYGSVCKLCHWHSFCVAQLTASDDLTLIPLLGRKEPTGRSPRLMVSPDPSLGRALAHGDATDDRTILHRIQQSCLLHA
jgi:predicted RecB family nuclease